MGVEEQMFRPLASVTLTRMDDPQKFMIAQFNPETVREEQSANYGRLQVPGLSHEILQFKNTTNLVIRMPFFFNATSLAQAEDIMDSRNFLLSSLVPRISRRAFPGSAPPEILLNWPNFYLIAVRVMSVSNELRRFRFDGRPITFTSAVTFEESREARITADEVAELGTVRGGRSG